LTTTEHIVVMGDADRSALPGSLDYEELVAGGPRSFDWPELDEDAAAAMCYTSGTTGDPKGVVYSHRSQYLHSMMINLASCLGLTERDAVLPVVPMFHANAWGTPYAAAMAGSKLVFAGQFSADPGSLAELIEGEQVTVTAGVPTVWIGLGNWVAASYYRDPTGAERFDGDWLRTGDVAVVDEFGSLQLVDRTKDLVKSGGEWISSVELESALMGHPAVLEAAVIGVPHARWSERPLACVVLKPGAEASKEDLLALLEPGFAKWWLPDDVVFIPE